MHKRSKKTTDLIISEILNCKEHIAEEGLTRRVLEKVSDLFDDPQDFLDALIRLHIKGRRPFEELPKGGFSLESIAYDNLYGYRLDLGTAKTCAEKNGIDEIVNEINDFLATDQKMLAARAPNVPNPQLEKVLRNEKG